MTLHHLAVSYHATPIKAREDFKPARLDLKRTFIKRDSTNRCNMEATISDLSLLRSIVLTASLFLGLCSVGPAAAAPEKVHLSDQQFPEFRCFVDRGTILTFLANVTDQQRQDALYSLLLAQLTADRNSSRTTQLHQWVDIFSQVLVSVGWESTDYKFRDIEASEHQFTLPKLAIREMPKVGSMAMDVDVFISVFNTLQTLPNNNSAVKLFNENAYDSASHNVTVIFASFDQSAMFGDTIVNLLLLNLDGVKDAAPCPLSHTYNTDEVRVIWESHSQLYLNRGVYAKYRNEVIAKLGSNIDTSIKEIALK